MKKFLDLSSWRTALGNLLPSAHGHQGGSRKAAIGSMLIMAFAFVGCDDSSSASAGPNDEPGVESSSSSSGKAGEPAEPAEVTSSSSEKAKSSSSDAQSDAEQSSSSEKSGKSSCSTDDASSSSVALATPCKTETEDNCEYGTVLDTRDGQTYKTVTIGTQTWMAENLNHETANSDWYKKYGRLYTWAAAIDSVKLATDVDNPLDCGYDKTCGLSGKVQGVCPEGWHLPSYDEWNTLFTAVGGQSTAGKVLKSQTGWTAYDGITNEDAFGFSALPAGFKYSIGVGDYDYEGFYAHFWSSTEYGSDYAYGMVLYYNGGNVNQGDYDKYVGFSVRCLKD